MTRRNSPADELANKSRSTQRPRSPQRGTTQGFLSVLCVQAAHFFRGCKAGHYLSLAIASLVLAASVSAITPPAVKFTDTRLKNGLRVIVAEDHTAPVFSIAVVYDVGSRDERNGRSGFAHLFEHMMFKGSANVGPGEHFFAVFSNGGSMNGTTNKERTLYYDTLPSNQLDLALFLEADRMRSLDIVKENLDNQRNAVQEERRQGRDNQPYGRTGEAVDEQAFDNAAYRHSVI